MDASIYDDVTCEGFPYYVSYSDGPGYAMAIELLDAEEELDAEDLICGDIAGFETLADWNSAKDCEGGAPQYYLISAAN